MEVKSKSDVNPLATIAAEAMTMVAMSQLVLAMVVIVVAAMPMGCQTWRL